MQRRWTQHLRRLIDWFRREPEARGSDAELVALILAAVRTLPVTRLAALERRCRDSGDIRAAAAVGALRQMRERLATQSAVLEALESEDADA
jgi:hypothetical protein